jgi:hypothetical protein
MREVAGDDGRPRKCLETWGEIALHLNVEVRTAQRWEERMGLPVRRLDGSRAVYAYADELDQWRRLRETGPDGQPVTEPAPDFEQTNVSVVSAPREPVGESAPVVRRRWTIVGVGALAVACAVAAVAVAGRPELMSLRWAGTPTATAPAAVDEFHIVKMTPETGRVALGGNVEPSWGVYVTVNYALRSRDSAWLCIIADVPPEAHSGSVCADPVHMTRGLGTGQTRVIVTNTTANGPVLTKHLRMIVAAEKICPTVPGNYRTHDPSCFPNPFFEQVVPASFAWTHPGASTKVGVLRVSTPTGGTVAPGEDVVVTVNYLLQDAKQATICIRPVTTVSKEERPAGPAFQCSNTVVRSGFGEAKVSFSIKGRSSESITTAGLWIEMKGLYTGYVSWPLNWSARSD